MSGIQGDLERLLTESESLCGSLGDAGDGLTGIANITRDSRAIAQRIPFSDQSMQRAQLILGPTVDIGRQRQLLGTIDTSMSLAARDAVVSAQHLDLDSYLTQQHNNYLNNAIEEAKLMSNDSLNRYYCARQDDDWARIKKDLNLYYEMGTKTPVYDHPAPVLKPTATPAKPGHGGRGGAHSGPTAPVLENVATVISRFAKGEPLELAAEVKNAVCATTTTPSSIPADLTDSWNLLVNIVKQCGRTGGQTQQPTEHLLSMVGVVRAYLEQQFQSFVLTEVKKQVPTVKGFGDAVPQYVLKVIHSSHSKVPVERMTSQGPALWPQVYVAIRGGEMRLARSLLHNRDPIMSAIATLLQLMENDKDVSAGAVKEAHMQVREKLHDGGNLEEYKRKVLEIVGSQRGSTDGRASTDDFIWKSLNRVVGEYRVGAISGRELQPAVWSIVDEYNKLLQGGASGFLKVKLSMLTANFAEAVELLARHDPFTAVHFSIILRYYNLLEDSRRQAPEMINLVRQYVENFKDEKPILAFHYLLAAVTACPGDSAVSREGKQAIAAVIVDQPHHKWAAFEYAPDNKLALYDLPGGIVFEIKSCLPPAEALSILDAAGDLASSRSLNVEAGQLFIFAQRWVDACERVVSALTALVHTPNTPEREGLKNLASVLIESDKAGSNRELSQYIRSLSFLRALAIFFDNYHKNTANLDRAFETLTADRFVPKPHGEECAKYFRDLNACVDPFITALFHVYKARAAALHKAGGHGTTKTLRGYVDALQTFAGELGSTNLLSDLTRLGIQL